MLYNQIFNIHSQYWKIQLCNTTVVYGSKPVQICLMLHCHSCKKKKKRETRQYPI